MTKGLITGWRYWERSLSEDLLMSDITYKISRLRALSLKLTSIRIYCKSRKNPEGVLWHSTMKEVVIYLRCVMVLRKITQWDLLMSEITYKFSRLRALSQKLTSIRIYRKSRKNPKGVLRHSTITEVAECHHMLPKFLNSRSSWWLSDSGYQFWTSIHEAKLSLMWILPSYYCRQYLRCLSNGSFKDLCLTQSHSIEWLTVNAFRGSSIFILFWIAVPSVGSSLL